MSGTTITTAEINTAMNAAVAALRAGDYATAYTEALAAQGLMLAKPRSNFDRDELEWAPEKIDAFVDRMAKLKRSMAGARGGSFKQIPVRHQKSDGDCEC
jgi:hypothetical protein